MRIVILYLFLSLGSSTLFAQQFPVITSVDHNIYLINPGATGKEVHSVFSMYGRKQWTGISDSPFTQTLSGHSSISKIKWGIGGAINNDSRGIINTKGFQISTAYHIKMGERAKLGLGFTGNFNWYSLNFDKMRLYHPNDVLLQTRGKSKIVPDLSTGIAFHREDFTIGFSALNLLSSKVKFSEAFENTEAIHYYAHANWSIDFNDNFGINPSVIISKVDGYATYIDFRNTFYFKQMIEFAIGYRNQNEMILGAGFILKDSWHINYYYDIALSGVNPGIGSSHELMITYDFYYNPIYKGSKRRYKWIRRAPKASFDKTVEK
jgi:type IX secretion system PorP/SprF family membrane protein